MGKVVSQKEIDKAIKNGTVEPIEIKEPSVEIKVESKTHKLPKFIKVTQNVEHTKVYKPVKDEVDYSDPNARYNNLLNVLLVIMILILTLLIVIAGVVGLELLGVI